MAEPLVAQARYPCPPSASIGGSFDCGELLTDDTSFPGSHIIQWGSLDVQEPRQSENLHLVSEGFEPSFSSQTDSIIPAQVMSMNCGGTGITPSSPTTILPSQTLVCPSTPTANVATYFGTPANIDVDTSPFPSPTLLPMTPTRIESVYQRDQKILAVVSQRSARKKSDYGLLGNSPSLPRQGSSRRKSTASKKEAASYGYPEHKSHNNEYETRLLVPECIAAPSIESKNHTCKMCHQGFDRLEHYKRHIGSTAHRTMLENLNEGRLESLPPKRLWYCRVCEKAFNRSDNVKPHERTHLHPEGKRGKHRRISVEESLSFGLGDIDERINGKIKTATRRKTRSK